MALVFASLWLPAAARAQGSDLRGTDPGRDPERLREEPLPISVVEREEILLGRPAVDIAEALDLVPGVFAQSSRNSAQDTRVAIRGYGASAQFGIRGIRVLVDGVPTTLPDGQSEVDSIDLAFVDHIDVVRGPISSLYGGGGGGILSFTTVGPTEEPTFSSRVVFGSHNLSRYEALARGRAGATGWVVGLAHTRYAGYRDHARSEQTVGLAKLEHEFGDGTLASLNFSSVWAPEAQDPGALTQLQVDLDRKMARPAARIFDTGEELAQQKLSLLLRKPLGPTRELRLMGYWLQRDFENKLPEFGRGGQVEFDRTVTGGSLVYSDRFGRLRYTTGVDLAVQRDLRSRYRNLAGGVRDQLLLEQSETVTSIGPFVQAELDFGRLGLVAGLRYDWIEFDVGDRLVDPIDGDLSDRIRFRELSPRFGARYLLRPDLMLYGNLSTAFQVPTTTELRPPDQAGGFDSDRKPERSLGAEIGAKGRLGQRMYYDVALFALKVRNALVPFQDLAGDTFWRNAGELHRRGVEVALSALLRPGVTTRIGYTYADYYYHDYDTVSLATGAVQSFDGNRQPNVAKHDLGAELRFEHPSGLFSVLSLRHFSDLEVNDANTAESSGATISDARFGYAWRRSGFVITPFFGIRNWSGVKVNGTIRPNAAGGRYYEPAPESEIYGGLSIEFTSRAF